MTKAKEWAYATEQKMKNGKFMPEYKAKQYTVSEIIDKYRKTKLCHKKTIYPDKRS